MIIVLAGLRGSGKSTQCNLLLSYLKEKNYNAEITKALDLEMKNKFEATIPSNSYMENIFLFSMLYRKQVEKIKSLISKNHIVIADRFIENFLLFHTYHGLIKTHGLEIYRTLESLIFENIRPNLTFFLEIDLETANRRIKERMKKKPRINNLFETKESYQNTKELFTKMSKKENCIIINGSLTPIEIHKRIIKKINL